MSSQTAYGEARTEVAAMKRELRVPDLGLGDGVLTDQAKYYSAEVVER